MLSGPAARIRLGRLGTEDVRLDPGNWGQGNELLSTTPADRAGVEQALRAFCGNGKLPVRWVDSPLGIGKALVGGTVSARDLVVPEEGLPHAVSIWSLASDELREIITRADMNAFEDASVRTGWSIVSAIARAAIENADDLDGADPDFLAELLADAGQFDTRIVRLVPLEAECLESTRDRGLLHLVDTLRRSCGPVVLLRGEVVATERPRVIQLDDRGRPHGEHGPAIAYGDGLEAWAWHGVGVPAYVVREPERITMAAIDAESNAEVRRVMIERFGWDRLAREGGATLVHEDETGRLWRRNDTRSGACPDGRGRQRHARTRRHKSAVLPAGARRNAARATGSRLDIRPPRGRVRTEDRDMSDPRDGRLRAVYMKALANTLFLIDATFPEQLPTEDAPNLSRNEVATDRGGTVDGIAGDQQKNEPHVQGRSPPP